MIKLDTAVVRPGGVLKGTASWDEPAPGAARPTLWLVWRSEIRPDQIPRSGDILREDGDYRVVAQQTVEASGAPVRFEFAIPAEGPLTYEGKLLRVIWELLAGTQKGASPKVVERVVFSVLGPGG